MVVTSCLPVVFRAFGRSTRIGMFSAPAAQARESRPCGDAIAPRGEGALPAVRWEPPENRYQCVLGQVVDVGIAVHQISNQIANTRQNRTNQTLRRGPVPARRFAHVYRHQVVHFCLHRIGQQSQREHILPLQSFVACGSGQRSMPNGRKWVRASPTPTSRQGSGPIPKAPTGRPQWTAVGWRRSSSWDRVPSLWGCWERPPTPRAPDSCAKHALRRVGSSAVSSSLPGFKAATRSPAPWSRASEG